MSDRDGPVEPRPAATVIVVRPGDDGQPEVLLLKRHAGQGFMANVWVFPGGRVDTVDHAAPDPHRAAAIRETAEEAGVTLAGELHFCAHWVTPPTERKRFDTRFYLSLVAAGTSAVPDTTEVTDALWLTPEGALERHRARNLPLSPPTWLTLHAMTAHADCEALTAWAASARPEPIAPGLELVAGRLMVRAPHASLVLVDGCWELAPA